MQMIIDSLVLFRDDMLEAKRKYLYTKLIGLQCNSILSNVAWGLLNVAFKMVCQILWYVKRILSNNPQP